MYYIINRENDMNIVLNKKGKYFDRSDFEKYSILRHIKKNNNEKPETSDNIQHDQLFELTYSPKNFVKTVGITFNEKKQEWINFVRFKIENSNSSYRYTNKPNLKLNSIVSITVNNDFINKNFCTRETQHHKYLLFLFICCFRHLNPHGKLLTRTWSFCDDQTIDILYLGLLLFKKLIFCWGYLVYYEDFDPIIDVNEIINILDNNKKFIISYKPKLYKLKKYITDYNKQKLEFYNDKLSLKKKIEKKYIYNIKLFNSLIHKENLETLKETYKYLYNSINNEQEILTIHKKIKYNFYKKITAVIIENYLNKCIQINMNLGFTSYLIVNTIKYLDNSKLYIIDENQEKIWNKLGEKLLKGYKKYYKVDYSNYSVGITKFNIKKNVSFNLLMIDGWSTMKDTFYLIISLEHLIDVGGFICIENILFETVEEILNNIDKLLLNYKIYYKDENIILYKKISINENNLEYYINNY